VPFSFSLSACALVGTAHNQKKREDPDTKKAVTKEGGSRVGLGAARGERFPSQERRGMLHGRLKDVVGAIFSFFASHARHQALIGGGWPTDTKRPAKIFWGPRGECDGRRKIWLRAERPHDKTLANGNPDEAEKKDKKDKMRCRR
jgi:hypothetical protein